MILLPGCDSPKDCCKLRPGRLQFSSTRCDLLSLAVVPSETIYFGARKRARSFAPAFKAKRTFVVKRKIDGQVQLVTPAFRSSEKHPVARKTPQKGLLALDNAETPAPHRRTGFAQMTISVKRLSRGSLRMPTLCRYALNAVMRVFVKTFIVGKLTGL